MVNYYVLDFLFLFEIFSWHFFFVNWTQCHQIFVYFITIDYGVVTLYRNISVALSSFIKTKLISKRWSLLKTCNVKIRLTWTFQFKLQNSDSFSAKFFFFNDALHSYQNNELNWLDFTQLSLSFNWLIPTLFPTIQWNELIKMIFFKFPQVSQMVLVAGAAMVSIPGNFHRF